MTNVAFDTHRYVKRLTAAGMPENQAEVIADEQRSLIEYQLATKRDIKELEAAIKAMEANTQQKFKEVEVAIKTLETNTQRDIKTLESAIKQQEAAIKAMEISRPRDLKELEQRITIRLGMMMTAAILAVSALVTIF